MAGELLKRSEIAAQLPKVYVGDVAFPIAKNAQYSLTPRTKMTFVPGGANVYKKEERQPRTLSVGVNDFVQGDITSLSMGDVVDVQDDFSNVSFKGVITRISASGVSVKEDLTEQL